MTAPNDSSRWPRVIVHADMDAFYAAIEQLDDARLRGLPVLVGPPSRRGVVLTASYEARPFGVGSAMPMAEARRRCPQALVVPPRFARYREISRTIMRLFTEFSPAVEPLSLDEAFLDMTGSHRIFGAPRAIGERLQAAIRDATGGLTASIGVASTKYVAKVASGHAKPNGLTVVPPDDAAAWLAPQPIRNLWGVGAKTERTLNAIGLETIGDVAERDPRSLERELGELGPHLHALARGIDPRPVVADRESKSIGSERTLETNVADAAAIEHHLRQCADAVARRLRKQGLCAAGVRVKLKRTDFRLLTRQRPLDATDVAADLFAAARSLLPELVDAGPFRLVGVAAFDFRVPGQTGQLELEHAASSRARALETALDRLHERFGESSVRRAAELASGDTLGGGTNLDFLDE